VGNLASTVDLGGPKTGVGRPPGSAEKGQGDRPWYGEGGTNFERNQ